MGQLSGVWTCVMWYSISAPAVGDSDRALARFPVRVAQLALVQLAVRVARQLLDEVDRARRLVLRQLVDRPRQDLGFELGPAVGELDRLDDRLDLFAPVVVG